MVRAVRAVIVGALVGLIVGVLIVAALIVTRRHDDLAVVRVHAAAAGEPTVWFGPVWPHALPAGFDPAQFNTRHKPRRVPVSNRVTDIGVWDRLAACESGGRWDIHNSVHEGGLQFALSTWDAYRPAGFPPRAWQATREQQITVAERVLAAQGWKAWPTCSRRLGLR